MFDINNQNEQLSQDAKKALDETLDLVSSSISSVEKLTHIQLENSRLMIEETANTVKQLTTLRDPREIIACVNRMAVDTAEKNIAAARSIYSICDEMKAKFSKLAEARIHSFQQNMADTIENFSKLSPNGTIPVTDSFKSFLNNSNQAFETASKMASQAVETVKSNLQSATDATVQAIKTNTTK